MVAWRDVIRAEKKAAMKADEMVEKTGEQKVVVRALTQVALMAASMAVTRAV